MATISVTIDDKTYRMACDEGQEEHLKGLAEKFDQYISHLKSSFGEIGDHRLSVMAGIMVMDEMAEMKKTMDALSKQMEDLKQENINLANDNAYFDQSLSQTVDKAANQIEDLANKLASVRLPH